MPAEAMGGLGVAHDLRAAQQADAQGAGQGRLAGHQRIGRTGGAFRKEPVRKEGVVGPGRLAVGFPGQQAAGGPVRKQVVGGQFQGEEQPDEDGGRAQQAAAQAPCEGRPGGEIRMPGDGIQRLHGERL